jgi:hypothetical protein
VYGKRYRPLPRKQVTVVAGPAVDLGRFRGADPSADTLREMTDVMMRAICELVGELRGETPPVGPLFRPRSGRSA